MAAEGVVTERLRLKVGDTHTIIVRQTEEDDPFGPLDISGRTYRAQVRRSAGSKGEPMATFACSITNGPGGEVACVLTSIEAAKLKRGPAYIDVEETIWTSPPIVDTIVTFPNVEIEPDGTR